VSDWGVLRRHQTCVTLAAMELPIDRAGVNALLIGVWDANRKLDEILSYIYGEDDGEEETETEP
jgi:hypothetical protein